MIDHDSGQQIDRININSRALKRISTTKLIVFLIDALISQKQFHYGAPGRGSYRNKERANLSKDIGMIPSSTGSIGGKETGETLQFYYNTGSQVDILVKELLSLDFVSTWEDRSKSATERKSGGKRFKYTCPNAECTQCFYAGQKADFMCALHNLKAVRKN